MTFSWHEHEHPKGRSQGGPKCRQLEVGARRAPILPETNISDITNLQKSVIFLLYIIWIEKKYEICFWQITNLRKSTSAPELHLSSDHCHNTKENKANARIQYISKYFHTYFQWFPYIFNYIFITYVLTQFPFLMNRLEKYCCESKQVTVSSL